MNKYNFALAVTVSVIVSFDLFSQSRVISLEQTVQMARDQSQSSLLAETIKENRYWEYRTFRSNYLPSLAVSGTLPDFNRSFTPVTQPDGTTLFQPVAVNNSDVQLALIQNVGLTGGRVFASSRVNRFDDFDNDITRFSGSPFFIGISQPLFGYNELKWDKKIEPLLYEESLKGYVEDLEQISLRATDLFFDMLLAQITQEIAQKNVASNDTILKIGQGRYGLGKIAENDLLQLELNLLNSNQEVAQSSLDFETARLRLMTYIGMTGETDLSLAIPDVFPEFIIDETVAVTEARKNRQEAVSYKRRLLQADRDVALARGTNGLNANLFATFGLSSRGDHLNDVYMDADDQQQVRIGFDVPILDWGKQKSIVKTAEANKKLVTYTVAQDEINFDQEVLTLVRQFEVLRQRLTVSKKADEIGERKYEISKNRYLIGKISITDLNLALQDKDIAKRNYVQSLRDFWTAYYEIRRLCLYDFVLDMSLMNQAVDLTEPR
ncbi:MAG: membrane protein [Cyclobacteriaceae bacterium]|nr:MAG: membrane protein [Cyclobacteriaceae bacterium]